MIDTVSAPPVGRRRARLNLVAFGAVVVGGGWVFVALDLATGALDSPGSAPPSSTIGQGLWIIVPALVATGLYLLSRDVGGPLGLSFQVRRPWHWYGLAVLLYLVIIVVLLGVGSVTGLAEVSVMPRAGEPAFWVAVAGVLAALTVKNAIEEFIFRGYGTRTAAAAGLPRLTGHVVVGVAWALWHLPLYLAWTSAADLDLVTSVPMAGYLALFGIGVVALGVLLGEMRLQTRSIWPGVVLHTVGGALATPLLLNGHVVYRGGADALIGVVPGSVAIALIFAGIGLAVHRHRRPAATVPEMPMPEMPHA